MSRSAETRSAFSSTETVTEVRRKCDSLLGSGSFEIVWEEDRDEEPRTLRDPLRAERIAADVPVVLTAA